MPGDYEFLISTIPDVHKVAFYSWYFEGALAREGCVEMARHILNPNKSDGPMSFERVGFATNEVAHYWYLMKKAPLFKMFDFMTGAEKSDVNLGGRPDTNLYLQAAQHICRTGSIHFSTALRVEQNCMAVQVTNTRPPFTSFLFKDVVDPTMYMAAKEWHDARSTAHNADGDASVLNAFIGRVEID